MPWTERHTGQYGISAAMFLDVKSQTLNARELTATPPPKIKLLPGVYTK